MRLPPTPGAPPPSTRRRGQIPILTSLVAACAIAAQLPGEAQAAVRVGCGPADAAGLSAVEVGLWEEHGLGRPADHLAPQADIRKDAGTTVLRLVAILVDFPDLAADRVLHSREYFDELLFSRGLRPGGSVAEFLDASSRGRLRLEGEVRGWFTVSQYRNIYTAGVSGLGGYPANSQRLAEEAIYLADPTINFADYDNEGPDGVPDSGDDDEIVDGFIIVHAGSGRGEGGTTPNDFISVHWWTPDPVPVDGVFGRYFTLNPENGEIGIFLHEIGHLLGLPDLYDTDGGSAGIGQWSMMAGGWTLDGGRTPADFDGWCKSKLGFVDVKRVFLNSPGEAIAPTAVSGQVYRLWADGGGTSEYFILENRLRTGLDAYIPGEGLLIYHVDERVATNRNPNHYKVAVEQADGLYQLENRFASVSFGDPGDPYIEGREFGRTSDPSSFAYDGTESHVAVFNIGPPDATGARVADLHVEPGAVVTVDDIQLVEMEGNGDGMVTPGEVAGILPRLGIARKGVVNLVVSLRSLDPRGEIVDTTWAVGTLPAGSSASPPEPLRVRVVGLLPTDPYGLKVELTAQWDAAPRRVVPVELGLGTLRGIVADFNLPEHGWTHAPLRVTAVDQWLYGPTFGLASTPGFKYGSYPYGFASGADAVLTSPVILLPPHAILQYDQLVDITFPDTTVYFAGGIIEVSANGGDWQQVTPEGGYPEYYGGETPGWLARPIFAGRIQSGAFHTVRVPLDGLTGAVRIRFHFRAERGSSSGSGWRVDNIRVLSDPTPVRVVAASAVVDGGDVRLSWELAEPLPAFVRWRRGREDETAEAVSGWTPAAVSDMFIDPGAAARAPLRYWLDGKDRDGRVETWGPVEAVTGATSMGWGLVQNPFRGPARFTWSAPLREEATLEIFDVRGRRVVGLHIPAGLVRFDWDGNGEDGRALPAGIYFARFGREPLPPLRLVRLP